MTFLRSAAAVLGLALMAGPQADEVSVTLAFSRDEIRIIQAYYRETSAQPRRKNGAGRRLPRGIAKNLARGKSLPPGIAKQYFPAELTMRLPPPPEGHERIIVVGKILLVEIATQAVRDVLTDVLFD